MSRHCQSIHVGLDRPAPERRLRRRVTLVITSKRKTRRRFRCMFCALFFGDGNLKQRFRCEFCALLLPSSSRGAAPSGSALLAPPRHGADSVGDSLAARASRAASVSIASSTTPLSHCVPSRTEEDDRQAAIDWHAVRHAADSSLTSSRASQASRLPLCSTVSSHWLACWLAAVEQIFLSPYPLTNPHTLTASTA